MNKALLVGINTYPGAPLQGCVNDVQDMAEFLVAKCGFAEADIRLLVDERATASAMRERLKWLTKGVRGGDRIFFHYSGHGAQVATRDASGEPDGLDEVICIAGDTKIPLLDGTEATIAELAERGGRAGVYSMDEGGNVQPGHAVRAWKTGDARPVLRVTLDNGESVRCTPEHRWMMRDGSYSEARDLRPGDSLMPLYRGVRRNKNGRGYETVYNPATDEDVETHRITAGGCPPEIRTHAKEQGCGAVRHHKNFNCKDNRPENMEWMTWNDHLALHAGTDVQRAAASVRSKALWANPEMRARIVAGSSARASARESDPEVKRQRSEAGKRRDVSAMWKAAAKTAPDRMRARWSDPAYRAKMVASQRREKPGTAKAMRERWEDPAARALMIEAQKASAARRPRDSKGRLMAAPPTNHKVVAVIEDGVADVYDLSVPGYENFAVAAGVFLHNCPVSFDWTDATMIRDKEIAKFFARVPPNTTLMVSDSCHSAGQNRSPSGLGGRRAKRLLPPPDIAWRNRAARGLGHAPVPTNSRLTLISGCRSDQTSADATFNNRPNGALTYYLLQQLNAGGLKIGLAELTARVAAALVEGGYDQVPQLVGGDKARTFLP